MVWKSVTVVVLVVAAVAVLVQSTLTKTQIYKISEVRTSEILGGMIVVQGTITHAYENIFILDDGTGKVEVDTCPVWYKRISLYRGDRVMIVGQVANTPSLLTKTDFVLNAYKITRDREIIVVRRSPGKPPWLIYRTPESASSP